MTSALSLILRILAGSAILNCSFLKSSEQTLPQEDLGCEDSKKKGNECENWIDFYLSIENKVWTPQSHDLTGSLLIFKHANNKYSQLVQCSLPYL